MQICQVLLKVRIENNLEVSCQAYNFHYPLLITHYSSNGFSKLCLRPILGFYKLVKIVLTWNLSCSCHQIVIAITWALKSCIHPRGIMSMIGYCGAVWRVLDFLVCFNEQIRSYIVSRLFLNSWASDFLGCCLSSWDHQNVDLLLLSTGAFALLVNTACM